MKLKYIVRITHDSFWIGFRSRNRSRHRISRLQPFKTTDFAFATVQNIVFLFYNRSKHRISLLQPSKTVFLQPYKTSNFAFTSIQNMVAKSKIWISERLPKEKLSFQVFEQQKAKSGFLNGSQRKN